MLNIIFIKKLMDGLVEYVYQDLITKPEKDTFLYKLLNDSKDGNFDFFIQAKALFSRNQGSPRKLKILLEYPKDKTSLPAYVIREPGKTKGPANNIGKIEGFYPGTDNYRYSDSRLSSYEIMCFSENMLESIMMSEILYALLVASTESLTQRFDTIEYTMKELMMNSELIPTPIFIRSIGLEVSCIELIPGLVDTELLGKVIFDYPGMIDSYPEYPIE